jgi:hypothetical protein
MCSPYGEQTNRYQLILPSSVPSIFQGKISKAYFGNFTTSMRLLAVLTIFLLHCLNLNAQGPYLKPSIGLAALPADNSPVCSIPVYQGSFYNSGYILGDTINDFTLYTIAGSAVNMATVLQAKTPVLLVAGSYTCPVFRQKVVDINAMTAFYGSQLKIYVIYTVEAHPSVNPSPYSGAIWLTSQNQSAGILFAQPATYGQRKAMVDTMNAHLTINAPVLVDGPCNEWWSHFGPAPNNAYLIDTNGVVRAKNGWYNRLPDNMWCSIDTLLGTSSGQCSPVANNGNFSFSLLADSTISGPAGSVLTIHGMLRNLSAIATATVNIQKAQNNTPATWQTALCTDVCLGTNVNQTQVIIPPADSQSFTFYFYTDNVPASGNMQVNFTNPNNSNNKTKQKYYSSTWPLSLRDVDKEAHTVQIFPNPSSGRLTLSFSPRSTSLITICVLNVEGEIARNLEWGIQSKQTMIDLSDLPRGLYFLQLRGDNLIETHKISLQ